MTDKAHGSNAGSDVWATWGSKWSPRFEGGPASIPVKLIPQHANDAVPFSTATGILDIGCGTGELISRVMASYATQIPKEASVIAADLSPGMIELVRQRQNKEPSMKRVETLVCDAKKMSELADGSMSHVLSAFTLYFLAPQGLIEAFRVLKEGGVLVLSSMSEYAWIDLMKPITAVRPDKTVPDVGPDWTTEEGVKGQFAAAGFHDTATHKVPFYVPFEDPTEIVDFIIETMPTLDYLAAGMSEEEMSRWRELMIQYVKTNHPDGKLPGAAIIAVGRK